MKRRTLLAGFGSSTLGIGTIMGSSAFSRTDANRTVTVEVADDYAAYLTLDQHGGGGRSVIDGSPGKVRFTFPGVFESSEADGLGLDSVYAFDADANETGRSGLFEIRNSGTKPVRVYGTHDSDSPLDIELYDVDDENRKPLTKDNTERLKPGTGFSAGLRIETTDADVGEFDETITVAAFE